MIVFWFTDDRAIDFYQETVRKDIILLFSNPSNVKVLENLKTIVSLLKEGLNGVNRQPSNGLKINRQPSKTEYFYRQPSNEGAKISRQTSQISLNDRDRLT